VIRSTRGWFARKPGHLRHRSRTAGWPERILRTTDDCVRQADHGRPRRLLRLPRSSTRPRCRAPGRYPAQLMQTYRRMLDDTTIVQAICEDYRAGATVDRDLDDADLGRRRIECPLLALWSAGGALPRFYGDVLDVWRPWTHDVTGWGVDAVTSSSKTSRSRSSTHCRPWVETSLTHPHPVPSRKGRTRPCPPTHPPAHSRQTHLPPR